MADESHILSVAGVLADTPELALRRPVLTDREHQIAKRAAAGAPSRQIAQDLNLSPRTVDNHLLRVYAKLGVRGRAELRSALQAQTISHSPGGGPERGA